LSDFISPGTFNRGTDVRSSERTEPILDGALPIWGQLAISLNNLAGHWPELHFESSYSRDEALRIAANIAKLPELLMRKKSWRLFQLLELRAIHLNEQFPLKNHYVLRISLLYKSHL
jgi:hypothetical protein